ncbi:nnexin anxc4 [Diaporthe amygdali]|uniref:nnexin anxc4 n=1 Tax=Phomopsis amygdali TaxID=1214568 RepID=UPI0022FDB67C|nr:nnexin anxc4 [Diaporthe amygdali]KAJ0123569.1 nnexin anxc4 [Diaporthe amygdali]
MSLQVEDHRRTRSRSPGRRERSRSRSRGPPLVIETDPYAERERERTYEHEERRSYHAPPSPSDDAYYRTPRSPAHENGARTSYGDLRYDNEYRRDSPRDRHSDSDRERDKDRDRDRSGLVDAFLPQKYAKKLESSDAYNFMTAPISDKSRERSRDRRAQKKEKLEEDLAYGKLHSPPTKDVRPVSPRHSPSPSYDYGKPPQQWEYEKDERLSSYSRDPRHSSDALGVGHGSSSRARSRSPAPGHSRGDSDRDRHRERKSHSHRDSLTVDPRGSSASVVTVEPGEAPRKSAMKRSSSPQPPVNRMSSLSVSTPYNPGNLSVSAAPASPLLESYHGTYQQASPMPSPLLLPTHHANDPQIMDISPIGSEDERSGGKRRSRRARFADPEDDAQRLADALKGSKPPKTEPLIEILPGMTHEQIMDLRAEYKRLVKTGPERKGVNVAKHVRVRLKDEDPSLMKACYATALGRWESEAYWSSFWYQGDKTRRELLIESLMGRTNDEIRAVKDAFSDKKYGDSLTRCMKQELKEDKFKKAVLMVLDEQRMDEVDSHGHPLRIDHDLVESDVHALHRAVKADKGGESAMIAIVVMRSDSHLREILRVYNEEYRANFARDALKKSGNLVGELLAHILNGVINKPVRDALLVHHALTASKKDGLRRELLTSRLVRFHWDRHHMAAIKRAYRERYGKDMMEAVRDGTSGEWGQFCQELCISRMPDDVKRVERIQLSR